MGREPAVVVWIDWTPLLAGAIRRARSEKGVSQETLARLADIDRSYVGAIEHGKHALTFMKLMQILEALNLQPQRFFTEFVAVSGRWIVKRDSPCIPLKRPHTPTYLRALGAALRIEREIYELSQTAVAAPLGMSRSWLSEIEQGLGNPTMPLVMRILQALEFDPGDFFAHIPLMALCHPE